jgi:sugar lactone lactonase YvrE
MTSLVATCITRRLMFAILLVSSIALSIPAVAQRFSVSQSLNIPNLNKNVSDVAADSKGNVVVTVPSDNKIYVYSEAGTLLRQLVPTSSTPVGVAFSSSDTLYVTHQQDAFVRVYDLDGNVQSTIGSRGTGNGQFIDPRGIRILKNGDILVSDSTRIQRLTSSGVYVSTLGAIGTNSISSITDFDVDPAGNVWVVDGLESKLKCLNSSGTVIRQFGVVGVGTGQLNSPSAVSVDRHGFVYVSEVQQRRVQKFTSKGIFVSTVAQFASTAASEVSPANLHVTQVGTVIVGLSGPNGGGSFHKPEFPQYRYQRTLISGIGPAGIAYDKVHGLYVSDHNNRRQLKVSLLDGSILAAFSGQGMDRPQDVTVSKNGTVYVADTWNLRVQRFTSDGQWVQSYAGLGTGGTLHSVAADEFDNFLYLPKTSDGAVLMHPNGTVLKKYGTKGTGNGGFANPWCVKFGVNNDLFISDGPNQLVQVFDVDGAFIRQFSLLEDGGPDKLAINEIGQVAVAPYWNRGYFKIFDITNDNGTTVNDSNGIAISRPKGMVFLENNNLLVADAATGKIYIYEPYYTADIVPPVSTLVRSPNVPSAEWTSSNVLISIDSTDAAGSGVKEIHYSVNMGTEQVVTGSTTSFTLSENGTHSIAYYAVDNAGNTETTKYATVRIDKTRPTVDAYSIGSLVTVIAQDTVSGVASTKVSIDGATAVDYTGSFIVPVGAHTVTYWATDQAGNESTREVILVGVSVASVAVSPTTLFATKAGVGTVKLSLAAPAGGVVVMLDSNSPAVSVPVSVTVPAGTLSATFPVTARTVATDTKAVVTASVGGQEVHGTVYVLVPFPKTLTLSPTIIIGGDAGVGTVALASTAGVGGQVVNLTSSNTNVVVPASVTVPSGATNVTFPIQTSIVGSDIAVAISAEADGAGISSTLLVRRVAPKSITFAPSSVISGNSSVATLTVTKPAPVGGIVVDLRSASSNVTVPSTVTIAAGATTATFTVSTVPVKKSESAMIQAYAAGVKVSANITITATSVVSVTLNPTSVVGGLNSTATVTLNGVAPVGGTTVQIYSTNVNASVPVSVTVPAGTKTVTFPVTTVVVSANTTASIAAKYLGTTKFATLTIASPTVNTLSLLPSSLTGGVTSKMTIKLTGKAGVGGVLVTLTSSNTVVAQIPASVTVPAGADTVDVNIQTAAVASTTNVTLTAKTGTVAKTAVLTFGLVLIEQSLPGNGEAFLLAVEVTFQNILEVP